MDDFTYSTVGMTASDRPPPFGFRALRVRVPMETGTFDRAAEALLGWEMHRAMPLVRVESFTGNAAPGERVVLRLGPWWAPCEVVWTVLEENRVGFGYGTLPGHPESGEESFVLHRAPDGTVEFTVFAISRPALRYLRAIGPVTRWAQRLAAHLYARALRALAAGRP